VDANAGAAGQDRSRDGEHQTLPSEVALRVKALESLLIEKGMVQATALDEIVQTYEHRIGPRNGARVVAKA
jgi:nitrile hydratase